MRSLRRWSRCHQHSHRRCPLPCQPMCTRMVEGLFEVLEVHGPRSCFWQKPRPGPHVEIDKPIAADCVSTNATRRPAAQINAGDLVLDAEPIAGDDVVFHFASGAAADESEALA